METLAQPESDCLFPVGGLKRNFNTAARPEASSRSKPDDFASCTWRGVPASSMNTRTITRPNSALRFEGRGYSGSTVVVYCTAEAGRFFGGGAVANDAGVATTTCGAGGATTITGSDGGAGTTNVLGAELGAAAITDGGGGACLTIG